MKKGAKGGRSGTSKTPLKGVVVVTSGIEKPRKDEIIEIATKLGAKYRPHWTADSTHLISSIIHTPKYYEATRDINSLREVPEDERERNVYIVNEQWIYDCNRLKQRLPEGNYRVSGDMIYSEEYQSEEDEEEWNPEGEEEEEEDEDEIELEAELVDEEEEGEEEGEEETEHEAEIKEREKGKEEERTAVGKVEQKSEGKEEEKREDEEEEGKEEKKEEEGEKPRRSRRGREAAKGGESKAKTGKEPPKASPYTIEHAPSGRAKCRDCQEPIKAGDLRVRVTVERPSMPYPLNLMHHLECFHVPQHITSVEEFNLKDLDAEDEKRVSEMIEKNKGKPERKTAASRKQTKSRKRKAPSESA